MSSAITPMTTKTSNDKSTSLNHEEKRVSNTLSGHHVEVMEIDEFKVMGLSPEDADFFINYPDDKKQKITRKVDWRLIPMLTLLYVMSFIDRANIGNAKIEGMVQDLGLTDSQYSLVLSIFFIPYMLFEIPSNIIVERLERPSLFIGFLVTSWGIVMTCTGLVRGFGGLMGTRILLGVFEAGLVPAAIYLCSYWYMPKHLAMRLSLFYLASSLSGAFSGLLAAAIAGMDGVGGYEGWRWIFLLEGLGTVVVGIMCFFLLVDTPKLSGRWLAPDEIRYLELSQFIKQGGNLRHEIGVNMKDLIIVSKNWRIYVMGFYLFCQATMLYGFKFTMPTIMKAMGYSSTIAQLASAPPYVVGAITTIIVAKFSDKYYWRMPFVAVPFLCLGIAYSILIGLQGDIVNKKGVAYFAVVLATAATFPISPAAAAWNANNIAPAPRRAVGIALMNTLANFGGIVGSFMYIDHEAPKYNTGYGISVALSIAGLTASLLLEWYYKIANAKKDRRAEDFKHDYTEQELFDMGDKSPLFRYVL